MRLRRPAMIAAAFILAFSVPGPEAREIRQRVYLVPAGKVDGKVLAYLKMRIPDALPMSSGVAVEAAREMPGSAFDAARNQYDARRVIEGLSGGITLSLTNERAIIVTGADLYADGGDFVTSFADAKSGLSVISLYRLKGPPGVRQAADGALSERALNEALRALGLSLGLADCKNKRCAMYPPGRMVDGGRRASYCYGCRIALERTVSGGTLLGDKINKAVDSIR